MKKISRYAAPALDKGLDILEALSASGISQSQTEIAHALGRSPTEIFRMLTRLESRGYVTRDPASGKYHLSLKLYHLSHVHSPVDSLRRAVTQPLHELSETTGQASHLCVLDRDSLLVVMQVRSPSPVSISIEEGSRFPVETTTSGRLLLASLAPDERTTFLARSEIFRQWRKKQREDFLESLVPIGRQGYNVARSEITQGVSDISALIGSPGGPLLATITISCVSSLLGRSTDPAELLEATLATASQINRVNGLAA